jgi:putative phage-type endonuclease
MSNDEWLDKRRIAIGGSDAGAIMGMSLYSSPLTVYLQKKNLAPKMETSRAARRGKFLEPLIRAETVKEFPDLEIEPVPYMFYSVKNPFMAANIDGIVNAKSPVEIRGEIISGLGGFEAKSAKTNYGWGDDEIPDAYYAQVQHYISCYVLDDETFLYYVISRNGDFINRLIAAEKDFWENYIEKDIMPAPLGIDNEEDMITGMFEGIKGTIRLGENEVALCAEHVELNKAIKEMEERKKVVAIMLKEAIVNSGERNPNEMKASAEAGGFSVSWSRFNTKRVDSDALKRDGLYDQYSKVSESGRFVVTQKRGVA